MRSRRHGLPTVLLAPWRRAPVLLLRRGSVLVAVTGAAAVLAVSAAATPMFLSSVGGAALTRQLEKGCLNDSIPYIVSGSFGTIGGGFTLDGSQVGFAERTVAQAVSEVPHVRPTIETLIATQQIDVGRRGVTPFGEQLVSRTGFLDHITLVERAPVRGVYLTDGAARFLGGVHAGDAVTLSLEDHRAKVPVAGIYRNLEYQPPSQYWCAEQRLIYPPGYGAEYTPPMLVLADHDVFQELQRRLRNRTVLTFELPPDSYHMSVAAAREIDTAVRTTVAEGLTGARATGEVFFGELLNVRPNIGHLAGRSTATARAVQGAVAPAAAAGAVVALLLVGAAGSYWADRRRPEVRLLASRGAGPLAIGVKAALEMGPATVLGGAAGWGLAYLLVRAVGPGRVIDAGSLRFAAVVTAGALAAGVLLLGTAASLRARRAGDVARRARGRRLLALLPWELLALGAAAWALHRIAGHGATHVDATGVASVDLLALAFPLLFLAGAVGLAGRCAFALLRAMRGRGSGGRPAWYLAGRRLVAAPHVALVMLVAAALPIGALVYSAAVTRSVSASLHAKVSTYAGSDVAAELLGNGRLPRELAGRATKVARSEDQRLGPTFGNWEVDVLGVDRATFARGAFWGGGLGGGASLPTLLDRLAPVPGQALPALLVGVPDAAPTTLTLSDQGAVRHVRLHVVDRVDAFPGKRGRPLVVVDRAALTRLTADIGWSLWAKGEPADVLAAMRHAGVPPLYVVDRDRVLDASSFLSLTWTFGFLSVIATLSGLIAVGGLMLYLESRTRTRIASYVLLRRMGLRRRAHLGSLAAELGVLLVTGLLVGSCLAILAAWAVHGRLDVAPELRPGPALPLPTPMLAAVAGAVVAVATLGACGAQVSADRVRPAEVMRFDG